MESIFRVPRSFDAYGAATAAQAAAASDATTKANSAQGAAIAACTPKDFKDYLTIPIEWGIGGTVAPDAAETLTSTNMMQIRKFQGDTANQDIFLPVVLPPDIKPATSVIKYRVHFFITEATEPAGEGVAFSLKGRAMSPGNLLSATLGTPVAKSITGLRDVDDAWQADHAYALNDRAIPTAPNGFHYIVSARTGDFKSAPVTEPTWPTTINATVVDNHVTWTCEAIDYDRYSYVVTDWSGDVTITGLSPTSTFLELNFSRVQDNADDTYAQKVGIAFIELKFDQEPAT